MKGRNFLFDVEKVITAVKSYNCLYDPKHKDFTDFEKKEEIWKMIADEANLENGTKARTKWNYLLNRYKAKKGEKSPVKWAYFDKMKFVDDYAISSDDEQNSLASESSLIIDESKTAEALSDSNETCDDHHTEVEEDKENISRDQNQSPSSYDNDDSALNKIVIEYMQKKMKKSNSTIDDIHLFFRWMEQLIRTFSPMRQIEVRKKLLQIMFEAEREQLIEKNNNMFYSSYHPYYPPGFPEYPPGLVRIPPAVPLPDYPRLVPNPSTVPPPDNPPPAKRKAYRPRNPSRSASTSTQAVHFPPPISSVVPAFFPHPSSVPRYRPDYPPPTPNISASTPSPHITDYMSSKHIPVSNHITSTSRLPPDYRPPTTDNFSKTSTQINDNTLNNHSIALTYSNPSTSTSMSRMDNLIPPSLSSASVSSTHSSDHTQSNQSTDSVNSHQLPSTSMPGSDYKPSTKCPFSKSSETEKSVLIPSAKAVDHTPPSFPCIPVFPHHPAFNPMYHPDFPVSAQITTFGKHPKTFSSASVPSAPTANFPSSSTLPTASDLLPSTSKSSSSTDEHPLQRMQDVTNNACPDQNSWEVTEIKKKLKFEKIRKS